MDARSTLEHTEMKIIRKLIFTIIIVADLVIKNTNRRCAS